jgi:hypothetical protein
MSLHTFSFPDSDAFACFVPPTGKHKLSFSVFKIFYQGSLSYGTFCISGNYGTS